MDLSWLHTPAHMAVGLEGSQSSVPWAPVPTHPLLGDPQEGGQETLGGSFPQSTAGGMEIPSETGQRRRKERGEGSRAEVASGATGRVQEGSREGAGKQGEGPRDQQLHVHVPGETSVFRDRSDRVGLCPGLQRGLLVSPLPREDGPGPSTT